MSKKQTSKRGSSKPEHADADGNVDKIRDILFGTQMRDFEQRLEATEAKVLKAIEKLSVDMERRVENLDKFARREVDKLSERLKTERKERTTEAKQGSGELNRLAKALEAGLAEIDEQLVAESASLKNTLYEQGEDLAAQIHEARSQLEGVMEKETASLQEEKLARQDMAALLTEVAARLTKGSK